MRPQTRNHCNELTRFTGSAGCSDRWSDARLWPGLEHGDSASPVTVTPLHAFRSMDDIDLG